MSRRAFEMSMWLAALVLVVITLLDRTKAVQAEDGLAVDSAAAIARVPDSLLVSAAMETVQQNPFRFERRPSNIPFGTEPVVAPAPRPTRQTPGFVISGILGGPPWRAVVGGIPGREGSVVVREGDVYGDFRIEAITSDTVRIAGADTVWRFTVRRTWD